ncbi:TolC family protein [uncultured Helicobacter sp.]|uniref:TolC family protein n=1 Tax=uncultured Helicobacter sp. TaxID=175537 RepID=UPI00374F5ACF
MRWLATLAVIVFCACSTKLPTTEELQSKTHIPQSFSNLKNPTTNTSDILAQYLQEHTPIERFYALFDDTQLHALLDIALERNTNVLIMTSRLNQAKSQVKINTASMFPSINGNIGTNYTDRRTQSQSLLIRPGTNSTSANLSLSWELDLFGKLNALRQSSKKDQESAQANLQNAQITLLAEVSTLYFTLRDNAYNIALNTQILENLHEIESIGKQQYQKGLIDINTYKSLKASLTTQQNTLESLHYDFEQNKNALLVLLDINAEELQSSVQFLDSPKDLPTIARFDVHSIPSEVLLERPDVRASMFAFHSQLYKVTNAKAARLPTISLNGSIGQILYSNIAANSLVFQIANSLATPLLNRVSLRENYKIQQELSKEAFYTLQNTINTALSEIENALFDRDSKQRQVRNNKAVLEISEQAYQTDVAQWQHGVIDSSVFLTNKNAHLTTQTQYFSSQVSEILAVITLFKAFGGALQPTTDN